MVERLAGGKMTDDKKRQINIFEDLGKLLEELGWSMLIPDKNSVDHLIIGKKEVIKEIGKNLDEDYDLMTKDTAKKKMQ